MTTIDLTTERIGRRTYIRGNTFSIKDDIKAAGGHWDKDERAWWLGDDVKAQSIVTAALAAPPKAEATGRFKKLPDAGRRHACKTGGNCSSFGSGRSCGGYDCDGY